MSGKFLDGTQIYILHNQTTYESVTEIVQRYDLHASTLHRPACETQLYEFQTSIPPTLAWSKRSCAWHHAGSVGWNGGHRGIPRMLLLYAAPGVESVRIRLSGLST